MKILPVYYFPPVAWFAAAAQGPSVVLEQWIHYRKQNFFNRTDIKTPGKILHLSVPIRKCPEQTPLLQREISYDWRWQHDHWKSLQTAYRRAPYFEYYEDELRHFFEEEHSHLVGYNLAILDTLLRLLDMDLDYTLSDAYHGPELYDCDLRNTFPTKSGELPAQFIAQPYLQVFGPDFSPNLSILDLLFNKGPESLGLLKGSWREA